MLKSRGNCQTWRVLAHLQMLVMLSKKPLLVLEQWHDIMEAVSWEDESGIDDVPADLERETLELIAVCSRG